MNAHDESWAWYPETGGPSEGPFPSRGAAVADAQEYFRDHPACVNVRVGKCKLIHPEDWILDDLDDVLEILTERFQDNVGVEDADFNLKPHSDAQQAQRELTEGLASWARKWVACDLSWYVDGNDAELVEVNRGTA